MGHENTKTTAPEDSQLKSGTPDPEAAPSLQQGEQENAKAGADTGGGSMPWGDKPGG